MIAIFLLLVQLGNKPWCSVLPNTPNNCHALDPKECDGTPVRYCIWDSKAECEKNKIYSDERCEITTDRRIHIQGD